MSAELKFIESFPTELREPIGHYARKIQELAGASELGLTLHGAVVAGVFDPARHVIHNVLVVDAVDLDMLKRLAAELPSLRAARLAVPLVLTPDYIQASVDSFPVELIEIQQQHRTIRGEDHFESLVFDRAHVRLQCERELKAMLLAMRQALLLSEGRDQRISELTRHAPDGILRTLRGLLWLKDHKAAVPASQVVKLIEDTINRPLPGVRDLLHQATARDWSHFQKLYGDLDALGSAADQW